MYTININQYLKYLKDFTIEYSYIKEKDTDYQGVKCSIKHNYLPIVFNENIKVNSEYLEYADLETLRLSMIGELIKKVYGAVCYSAMIEDFVVIWDDKKEKWYIVYQDNLNKRIYSTKKQKGFFNKIFK